jgi:3-oxoadipate CoA-transferase beta subunit
MDLASGAKRVFVMMEHQTKTGQSKIVDQCTYPLTGVACVSRIYTDLAVIDIVDGEMLVRDMAEGLTLDALAILSGVPLRAA